MNDDELFEAELKQLKPARPPSHLLDRLAASAPNRDLAARSRIRSFSLLKLFRISAFAAVRKDLRTSRLGGRWFAPASALAIGLGSLLLLRLTSPTTRPVSPRPFHATQTPFKANNVEIDRRLLASFDAIARLPDGAPVRLRCRQWTDQVRVVDSSSGVVIEQTQPRLEVIPVKFETY